MLLSLAYYLGARIGFVMQSPEVPQSILWLPNSLLLCALLVAPAAHWPWYLLAAFPAQLAVAAHVQAPILPLTLLFATNCLDAVLGATLVRHFVSSRLKLGRLRHMIVFLAFGATIPTVLVSFADAGLTILTGWGDNYWLAWSTRARANVLTNVLLVPTILGLYHDLRPGWHSFSRRTLVEAVALLVATGGVSYGIFADLEQQWCMYILLPLFLIGAARFGVGVIATQLFILAMMGSWHFLQSNSVFARYFGAADVFPIQLFLFALSVPLLCLASLVEERRATVTALRASARRVRRQFARLSTVYRSTPVGLAFVDCDLRVISANQRIIALSGGTFPVPAARTITECLPSVAGHIEPLVRGVCATGTPIVDSDIVVAHGGRIKHYVVTCDPVRSAADETIGVNIVMQDVTVRIRTQQALLKSREKLRESYVHRMELAGRMISAQEEERMRIAYELHDDLGQRIAQLSMGLGALRDQASPAALNKLSELSRRSSELASAVRNLSHELHPVVLEHVGLAEALRSRCAQFQREQRIDVRYSADRVDDLADDVALSLYRIAQEALNNIARHARAKQVRVALTRTPSLVELSIADNGRGFDTTSPFKNVGLFSAEERARLIHGRVTVTSVVGEGTVVRATVPFKYSKSPLLQQGD